MLAQAPAPAPATGAAAPQTAAPAPARPAPGTVLGTPANDPVKGAAILAETRKALGGEERFKSIQRLEVKGKSARAQGQTLEGDFEIALDLPDKFRRREQLNLSDVRIEILQRLNGADAEQKVDFQQGNNMGNFDDGGGNRGGGNRGGGGGNRGRGNDMARFLGGATSDDPAVQKKAIETEMARFVMLWLVTSTQPVAWIGEAQSPDGKADVLEFTTPDGTATKVLIDQKSRLPLLMTWTGIIQSSFQGNRGGGRGNPGNTGNRGGRGGTPQPTTGPLQIYVSDYKTVDGRKFPHLIQSGANDETTEELVVKSVKVNPSFKSDLFTK